jgi:phosphotransferase system HPr-like phosphotransfer protein
MGNADGPQLRAQVTITDQDGLHLRPCAALVNTLKEKFPDKRPQIVFRAPAWKMQIGDTVVSDSSCQEIDPFDYFRLITLGWDCGTVFEVCCTGDQAQEAFATLRELFTGASHSEYYVGWTWRELNES